MAEASSEKASIEKDSRDMKNHQAMLKSNCSPKGLVKIMGIIQKNVKLMQAVEEMGFGCLQYLQAVKMEFNLIKPLLDNFNVNSCSIFGADITAGDIGRVLGVPADGIPIPISILEEEEKRLKAKFGGKKLMNLISDLKNLKQADLDFKETFLLIALGNFFCPSTKNIPSGKLYKALSVVQSAKQYNWGKYILEWLLDSIKDFQIRTKGRERRNAGGGGCVYFVKIFFLQRKYPERIDDGKPVMSAWTKKKLNQAWKQCKKKLTSGFVSGQPSEFVSGQPSEFVSGQQCCSRCNSVIYAERLERLEHAVFSKKQCHDDENIFDIPASPPPYKKQDDGNINGHGKEDDADDIDGHGEEDKADEMDGHGEEDKVDENLPLMEVLSTLKSMHKRTKKSPPQSSAFPAATPQPKPSPSLKRKNRFGITYARRKKTSTISSSTPTPPTERPPPSPPTGAPPPVVSDVIAEETSKDATAQVPLTHVKNAPVKEDALSKITGPDRAIVTRRKLLVLDINGVLACILHGKPRNGFQNFIPIYIPSGSETQTGASRKSVFKRPYCEEFLKFCFERFDVGIWSAKMKKTVASSINAILSFSTQIELKFIWDQSKCTRSKEDESIMYKETRKLREIGFDDVANILLVDDSEYKAKLNLPNTAIFPTSYNYKNLNDDELGPNGNLRVYLKGLASATTTAVDDYVRDHPFCPSQRR